MTLTLPNVRRTPEAVAYVEETGLRAEAEAGVELITAAFPEASEFRIEVEHDVDSPAKWLQIDVIVSGDIEVIHRRFVEASRRLGRLLGWPAVVQIRATYTWEPRE